MSKAELLYTLVDLPIPPDWLLQKSSTARTNGSATQATMNNWGDDFTARPLHKDGKVYKNAFNHSVFLDDAALSWARENITNLAKDIRSTSTLPGLERCGAHIDRTRNYTLMYLIEPGGNDHCTVFYREKGVDDLYRPREYHVDDYDRLIELKRVKLKCNAWNLVSARILHSIENITNGRYSIQVSLDDLDPGFKFINPVYL